MDHPGGMAASAQQTGCTLNSTKFTSENKRCMLTLNTARTPARVVGRGTPPWSAGINLGLVGWNMSLIHSFSYVNQSATF